MSTLATDRIGIPVTQSGDIYISTTEWNKFDLPPLSDNELSIVLENSRSESQGLFRFGGQILEVTIVVTQDHETFAVFSPSGTAPANENISSGLQRSIQIYWSNVIKNVSHSEYILPDQQIDISCDFVSPNLSVRRGEAFEQLDWRELSRRQRVLLVGQAGAGKTTLLRHWVLHETRKLASAEGDHVPIYVALRSWEPRISIEAFVEQKFSECGGQGLVDEFPILAHRGAIALVLDGFDEISSPHREKMSESLGHFLSKYNKSKLIISTRYGAEPDHLEHFVRMELGPLNYGQIKELIYHKLYGDATWWEFTARLTSERKLAEIAANPLALTLLIARFRRNEFGPSLISEALTAIFDAFVDEWDAVRGVTRRSEISFSAARKRSALHLLASYVSENKTVEFTSKDVEQQLNMIFYEAPSIQILKYLEESTSIIECVENDKWRFRHSLIREFLSAVHWLDKLSSSIDSIVHTIVNAPTGSVVRRFRFLSGLASDATNLFHKVLESGNASKVNSAIVLAQALTQRLAISPSMVRSCGELIEDGLAAALEGCRIETDLTEQPQFDTRQAKLVWQIKIISNSIDADLEKWLTNLESLLSSLHKMQEGSGRQGLLPILKNNEQRNLSVLAGLLECGGMLVIERRGGNAILLSIFDQ